MSLVPLAGTEDVWQDDGQGGVVGPFAFKDESTGEYLYEGAFMPDGKGGFLPDPPAVASQPKPCEYKSSCHLRHDCYWPYCEGGEP